MPPSLIFLGILVGFANDANANKYVAKIVGGSIAEIEKFPYQCVLVFDGTPICGCAILTTHVAATAAHCTEGGVANQFSIKYGSPNIGTGIERKISSKKEHANYNDSTMDYDITLVYLKEPIKFGKNVQPIPLPTKRPTDGLPAVVSGWGTTSEGGQQLSSTLQSVQVNCISNIKCQKLYDEYSITPRMVCAGTVNGGKDSCQGDSGGPLASDGKLVGIVSWGIGCARPEYPGVYASVFNLMTFINNNLMGSA